MPDDKTKWFTFMLAVIITLLGALGTLMLVLNSQTWDKLNRITTLFVHERDLVNGKIDKLCETQYRISERMMKIETEHTIPNNNKGK